MDTSALGAPQRASFYELQAANRRNSVLLVVVFIALVGALGLGLDFFLLGFDPSGQRGMPFPIATFFGVIAGGLYAMQGWFFGASQVLSASSARPANPANPEEKQYLNVVEEMAIAAGIPPPVAYVLPDTDPNAFAVGRDPQHASIAVTEGLLTALDREELQGVVSHEMSHVRNLDIRAMTLVTALFGAATLLSDVARRGLYWGGGRSRSRDSRDSGGGGGPLMLALFVLWMLLAVLAPILGQMLVFAVSRSREYLADASGAELTRNPLGLASALRKIAAAHEPTRVITQGTAHMCITDPRGMKLNEQEGGMSNLFGTHPPIGKRIALLESMAGVVGSGPDIAG